MATVNVYDMTKKKIGETDLADGVFAVKVNQALVHEAVCIHLSNCRQGTVSTKTRSEVRGGGKKPYKQKGTGQARHGSSRSPIFVTGGQTFGPRPRNWHIRFPKQQRRVALKMALSLKNSENGLFVIDKWISKSGKTADMAKTLKKWDTKKSLIITHESDDKTIRAVRNIPDVKLVSEKSLGIYDLIKYDHVLVTEGAVKNITERLS